MIHTHENFNNVLNSLSLEVELPLFKNPHHANYFVNVTCFLFCSYEFCLIHASCILTE